MIQQIHIENFRGIERGDLNDLAPLTVLVGPNGSGKSTVLEAIYVTNPERIVETAALNHLVQRRGNLPNGGDWILRHSLNGSPDAVGVSPDAAVVECTQSDGTLSTWKLSAQRGLVESGRVEPRLQVRLVESSESVQERSLTDVFTSTVERGTLPEVRDLLTAVAPGLTDVQVLTQRGTPTLYLIFGRRAIPLAVAGDGIQQVARRVFELAQATGVVLLEEPETHLHPGAMALLARAIWRSIERGIQVILSTHSLDLIDALLTETRDDAALAKLSVFRLALQDGQLIYTRIPGDRVLAARTEIQDDLR